MNKFKENNHSLLQLTDRLTSHYQIPYRSLKKETLATVMKKIDEKELNRSIKIPKINWYLRAGISAAAVIAILVTFYFFFTATIKISSGPEDILACRLPDMSRVVLQQNSTIKYNKYFWSGDVNLTGRAYFEVTKGDRFRVKTYIGSIEVLGTRFMVNSDNKELDVVCYQGSVKTELITGSYILEPGTRVRGSKSSAKKERIENSSDYPEFALFRKSFSNVPVAEVVGNIGDFFGVRIDIKKDIKNNFSGSIHTGSLESALEIVCATLQLNFKITDKGNYIIYR
jgi:transmembrane sensor